MKNEIGWYEKHVDSWYEFTSLLDEVVKPLAGQRHHFFYRGQVCKDWGLESSLFRQLKSKKGDLPRCFEIEQDAKREFESQLHLHMDPAALPGTKDWLGWRALMQHYGAPTRLLDSKSRFDLDYPTTPKRRSDEDNYER